MQGIQQEGIQGCLFRGFIVNHYLIHMQNFARKNSNPEILAIFQITHDRNSGMVSLFHLSAHRESSKGHAGWFSCHVLSFSVSSLA